MSESEWDFSQCSTAVFIGPYIFFLGTVMWLVWVPISHIKYRRDARQRRLRGLPVRKFTIKPCAPNGPDAWENAHMLDVTSDPTYGSTTGSTQRRANRPTIRFAPLLSTTLGAIAPKTNRGVAMQLVRSTDC